MTFYVTFGQRYRHEPHQYGGHPDGWTEVQADSKDSAVSKIQRRYGNAWSNIYDADRFDPSLYPRGVIERVH